MSLCQRLIHGARAALEGGWRRGYLVRLQVNTAVVALAAAMWAGIVCAALRRGQRFTVKPPAS